MVAAAKRGKQVIKNTAFLYVRMLFVLVVTLFTSRIVLKNLGVVDFGIYNVVAGVVTLFAFLNTALTVGVQRFLSFEIGLNNDVKVKAVFKDSVIVYILMAVLILLLVEPIGTFLIQYKLSIPLERYDAALNVFHVSLLVLVISILQSPFVALLTSYEKFDSIAFIAIIESVFKLLAASLIVKLADDNLMSYSLLLLLSALCVASIYVIVCAVNYQGIVLQNYFKGISWPRVTEISIFSFWNIFSSLAIVCLNQGLNILLNVFFNPMVNAARAISLQVNSAAYSFISNVHSAIIPQLAKSYAQNDLQYMRRLSMFGCKISYSLFLLLCVPLFFYSDFILHIWLDEVPHYTSLFVRLVLLNTLIDPIGGIVSGVAQALGQVRKYQLIVGIIYILTIPFSYIALCIYQEPEVVFVVNISFTLFSLLYRLSYLKVALNLSHKVILGFVGRVFFMIISSLLLNDILSSCFSDSLSGFAQYTICSIVMNVVLLMLFAFTKEEKNYVFQYVFRFFKK